MFVVFNLFLGLVWNVEKKWRKLYTFQKWSYEQFSSNPNGLSWFWDSDFVFGFFFFHISVLLFSKFLEAGGVGF